MSNHLNYFQPYENIPSYYENHLTRAFLLVLKYSKSSLFLFYDLAIKNCLNVAKDKGITVEIPFLSDLDIQKIDFYMQTSNNNINTECQKLSVLLTDRHFKPEHEIKKVDRQSIFDGVINISDELMFIIENKPHVENVWEKQLSSNLTNFIKVPAVITWKEIIENLIKLIESNEISGAEILILNDFLEFINANFPYLNSYKYLSLCNKNNYLINQRIRKILQDISINDEVVGYQRGWTYYLKTGLHEITRIGLENNLKGNEDYYLRLVLCYGDTMSQSNAFYQSKIPFYKINSLISKGWDYNPRFHINYMMTGIVEFATPLDKYQEYYEYWIANKNEIQQVIRTEIMDYLKCLADKNLIILDEEKIEEVNNKIVNTKRNILNMIPGICISKKYSSIEAEKLDHGYKFVSLLKDKVTEGLSILDKPIKFLKEEM